MVVIATAKNVTYFNMKYLYQYISAMGASFILFVVGIQLAALSPYLEILSDVGYYKISKISTWTRSMMTSCYSLGILPGAIISSYINDILGRKSSMILLTTPALLSAIFQYFAVHISMVYISLILRGMLLAWAYSVVSTYISEIASPHLRGPLTVFSVLFQTFGSLSGSLMQASLSIDLTAIIMGVTTLACLIMLSVISESPYFFIKNNQDEKCKQSLRKFRREQNIDKEYEEIKEVWNASQKAKHVGWSKMFTVRSNLQVFLICASGITVQEFTGLIIMTIKTHSLVRHAGLDLSLSQISLIVKGVGICATVLSIFVVDSWGRKPLFIFVSLGACIGHFITGLGFILEDYMAETSTALGITELIGNLIYLTVLGLGLAHLPYVLAAELFPTDIKSKGCSLLLVVTSLEGAIATQSFDLLSNIAYYLPFFVMSGWGFLGMIFGIIWVPETKSKSLAEIQKQLNM